MKADLIIHGGTIHSMDPQQPSPEAVALSRDQIVGVGAKDEIMETFASDSTVIVELQDGETLLPGFIEPHTHSTHIVFVRCNYIDCSAYNYSTYEQIEAHFRSHIESIPVGSEEMCIFIGWDSEMLPSLPELNFDTMDTISTDIPFLVIGQNCHVAWANRKAFQVVGVKEDSIDPPGASYVRDATTGLLTGQMLELPAFMPFVSAKIKSKSAPKVEDIEIAIEKQWQQFSSVGLTTVTELAYMPNALYDSLFQKIASEGNCSVRLALYQLQSAATQSQIVQSPMLWIAGRKFITDGSPHCGTAAVHEPYLKNEVTKQLMFPADSPCGVLNFTREALLKRVAVEHAQGIQCAFHAHGERAIEQVLDVIEEVSPK